MLQLVALLLQAFFQTQHLNWKILVFSQEPNRLKLGETLEGIQHPCHCRMLFSRTDIAARGSAHSARGSARGSAHSARGSARGSAHSAHSARLTRLTRLGSPGSARLTRLQPAAYSNRIRGSDLVFAPPDNARVRDVDGGRGWLSSAFRAASGTQTEVGPSTVTETEEEGELSAAGGWKRIGNGWGAAADEHDEADDAGGGRETERGGAGGDAACTEKGWWTAALKRNREREMVAAREDGEDEKKMGGSRGMLFSRTDMLGCMITFPMDSL
uniref:Uncharacterized protein n=1 Tax=Cucumis melo subsp. melo TaxID=412675 RepID=E5GBK6_CUCME|nr:hypothetical protein [Cucumis melo subsp. melo]